MTHWHPYCACMVHTHTHTHAPSCYRKCSITKLGIKVSSSTGTWWWSIHWLRHGKNPERQTKMFVFNHKTERQDLYTWMLVCTYNFSWKSSPLGHHTRNLTGQVNGHLWNHFNVWMLFPAWKLHFDMWYLGGVRRQNREVFSASLEFLVAITCKCRSTCWGCSQDADITAQVFSLAEEDVQWKIWDDWSDVCI